MWPSAGMACVCIDDHWHLTAVIGEIILDLLPDRVPMINEVLTVDGVCTKKGRVLLSFREIPKDYVIPTPFGPLSLSGVVWQADHFRPLTSVKQEDDVALFLPILKRHRSKTDA